MLLKLQKCNLQVQYKRCGEMHIYFLSRTFTDKSEEQKQQQDTSTSQADNMAVLPVEDPVWQSQTLRY